MVKYIYDAQNIFFCLYLSGTILANVNGVDTQLFKSTTDGLDFITVHSTRMLDPFTIKHRPVF